MDSLNYNERFKGPKVIALYRGSNYLVNIQLYFYCKKNNRNLEI